MTALSLMTLGSPEDFLAITPYMVGFHPRNAIVLLAFDNRQMLQGFKLFDLSGSSADPWRLRRSMNDVLTRFGVEKAAVIGYGDPSIGPILDMVRHVLEIRAIEIRMILRTYEDRYWNYLCVECRKDTDLKGTVYNTATSAVTAAAVYAGRIPPPSREELAQGLAPAEGPLREQIRRATRLVRARTKAMLDTVNGNHWAREVRTRVPEALQRVQAGEELSIEEMVFLGVLLTAPDLRDRAMTFIGPFSEETHLQLWSEVTRTVEPEYAAAPAALLAFVALRLGRSALAYFALERSLTADPHHRLALLMRRMLIEGLPQQLVRFDLTVDAPRIDAWIEQHSNQVRPILPEVVSER